MKVSLNGKQVWINYHHLYYFYVVVNEGGLGNASKLLLIGQPSLSSQIKQFEQSLDFDLFDRSTKRLILTPAGKVVHLFASRIFQTAAEMIQALQTMAPKQELKIGIYDNISRISLVSFCKNFLGDTTFSLSISRGRSSDLIKDLSHKKLDLIITNYAPSEMEAPGIHSKKAGSSPIVICASPSYKALLKGFPASLQSAPFMLPLPGSRLRTDLDAFFKRYNLKIKLVGESKDFTIQKLLALEGVALLAAPLSVMRPYIESNQLIEIGRPGKLYEELFVLTNNSIVLNDSVKSVLDQSFDI